MERPQIIRPPSEWRSYYLPLTCGCSNNTCAFCSWYGSKLQIREAAEAKAEIDALWLFLKQGIALPTMPTIMYEVAQGWDGRRVFLQDGDALVYPFARLKEILVYLNEKFPGLERIAAYATPHDIIRRSISELKELKELKLGMLYMGVESGDRKVLEAVEKGATYEDMVEAGRKTGEAGIELSVSVILGLGGAGGSLEHARGTARILSDIDPEYAGALTLTFVPNTPLYDQWQAGKFIPITPLESLKELKIIVEESDFSGCFFSSMHASNYFSVRGMLPREKSRMVKELDSIISSGSPELLRPEYMRGL